MQSVVRHLLDCGQELQVCTDYPEVFLPVKDRVSFDAFSRHNIDILAHYTTRKKDQTTTQWEDVCSTAKIPVVDLRLDWTVQNVRLTETIDRTRPLFAVLIPRAPMGRKDGFGKELLPKGDVIQKLINGLNTVQVGSGKPLYDLSVTVDMTNKTSITDMIDIVSVCDGVIGYPSFMIPLAESLNKPGLFVWAREGLNAKGWFVRAITPDKLLHKPNHFIVDDWSQHSIDEVMAEFLSVFDKRAGRQTVPG
jgi:hypothetical protein